MVEALSSPGIECPMNLGETGSKVSIAATAVICPSSSSACYRARAAVDCLRKYSLNVCIHWQQQDLGSHDESSALRFAPFAILFAASPIAFGLQRGTSIRQALQPRGLGSSHHGCSLSSTLAGARAGQMHQTVERNTADAMDA